MMETQMFELIKNLASVCGAFVTIIGLVTLVFRPIRKKVIKRILYKYKSEEIEKLRSEHENEQNELLLSLKKLVEEQSAQYLKQTEALKCVLRNTLSHLYITYIPDDVDFPPSEKENFILLYENYKALGGNSYIGRCAEELLEKKVKITSIQIKNKK